MDSPPGNDMFHDAQESLGTLLPPSSTDLPLEPHNVLSAISIFRILVDNYSLPGLTFEDFCCSLNHHEQCTITSHVHILVLDGLLCKELSTSGDDSHTTFELFCSTKLDEVTWPALLRSYLAKHSPSSPLASRDYYSLSVTDKLRILAILLKEYHDFDQDEPAIYGVPEIGKDHKGAKFWFTCKRYIAHCTKSKETRYYSTKEKLDELLPYFDPSNAIDVQLSESIRADYYDSVDQMSDNLVSYVLAYKTAQNRTLQSPAKYSGVTYGEHSMSTVSRRDIESMSMAALLYTVKQASEEGFTYGLDRLYLRYKNRELPTRLGDLVKERIARLGLTINHHLSWRSSSIDQVKLVRNLLLDIASKIPKYFMHDAWEKRITPWENAVFRATTTNHLAACLAFLESHMRPILFAGDWKKVCWLTRASSVAPSDKSEGEKENTEENKLVESQISHKEEMGAPGREVKEGKEAKVADGKIRPEHLTHLINQMQKSEVKRQVKVVPMTSSFTKIIDGNGRVMFALPRGAKVMKVRREDMTQVVYDTHSLESSRPRPLKVIQPEKRMTHCKAQHSPRNIVLSAQVATSLLKSPFHNIKGNVTLKPCPRACLMDKAFKSVDDPNEILEKLFSRWGQECGDDKTKDKIQKYLYSDSKDNANENTLQHEWRSKLQHVKDIAEVAVLTSVLCSNMRWSDITKLTILSENKYLCDDDTTVQRTVVDCRNNGCAISAQYKIVVMKQAKEEDESLLQVLPSQDIMEMMIRLDVGIHDLWVNESFITFNELYTYQHNQEKLKSIENAKIQEEKKKEKTVAIEKKDKSYFVDAETTMVVRRVLTNILDRVEIEERREKEKRGKKKPKTKGKARGPAKSTDEREQIRYFGKLDILLGRRKEQLKKTFFKKRQYLAYKIREDIRIEEEEAKRLQEDLQRQEEEEMAEKRKKQLEVERRKREKERRIRKAQENIERKLHKLQKVDLKAAAGGGVGGKAYAKSPKRPSIKTPKPIQKKSSIKIDALHKTPSFKGKLSQKTKFKFPPKKPSVKKTGKLSLTPRKSFPSNDRFIASPFRDEAKILGKRKLTREEKRIQAQPMKRLCIEIRPVKISRRERSVLEFRLNQYQRSIAKSLTTEDITHPIIDLKKKSMKSAARREAEKANIRERLQKLRKIATAKNRGNEVLAKLLLKQELVKKLAAQSDNAATEGAKTDPERKMVLQHHKNSQGRAAPTAKKKDTLYCICRRPYDHTRFYIGCDVCNNWYHGKCVGISPSMARNMSGYTCDGCKTKPVAPEQQQSEKKQMVSVKKPEKDVEEEAAEPEGDVFCICRTPYNQYSFYIGCDSCQEWYHGTCVGISEMEAEKIEVYICDKCKQQQGREEPKLTHIQIAGLIKILRELQMHKMSWPFREPNKNEDLTVIKEPMDLNTIHKKFQKKHYPKLTLFVKDVLRVFSNARQIYSEDSQRGRCADTLERYFVAKLNEFKLRHGLS